MTKPTPRKMRDLRGTIHDEGIGCVQQGCVPVEPEPSRSVQRRVAVQKGEPMPTFEPQETLSDKDECRVDVLHPTGKSCCMGTEGCVTRHEFPTCPSCGKTVTVSWEDHEEDCVPEPQELTELCADCHHPKDDPKMHLDAPGTNWSSAMHWFRAAQEPGVEQRRADARQWLRDHELDPDGLQPLTSQETGGDILVEDILLAYAYHTSRAIRAIPEAELQRVAEEIAEDAVFGPAQSESHRQTLLRLKSQRYLAILRTLEKKA